MEPAPGTVRVSRHADPARPYTTCGNSRTAPGRDRYDVPPSGLIGTARCRRVHHRLVSLVHCKRTTYSRPFAVLVRLGNLDVPHKSRRRPQPFILNLVAHGASHPVLSRLVACRKLVRVEAARTHPCADPQPAPPSSPQAYDRSSNRPQSPASTRDDRSTLSARLLASTGLAKHLP